MCAFLQFFATGLEPNSHMKEAFQKFGLEQNTIDFIGHALALYRDDEWVLMLSVYACMH